MDAERIRELLEKHSKPSRRGVVQLLRPDEFDPEPQYIGVEAQDRLEDKSD